MHRFEFGANGLPDQSAQFDQAGGAHVVESGIAALRLDDRIIIAAISDVDGERADALDLDLDIARGDIGGNVDATERPHQIGRASCRDRGWQYVSLSGVAGALKKKPK